MNQKATRRTAISPSRAHATILDNLRGWGSVVGMLGLPPVYWSCPAQRAAMGGIPGRSLWSSSRRMSIPRRGPAAIDTSSCATVQGLPAGFHRQPDHAAQAIGSNENRDIASCSPARFLCTANLFLCVGPIDTPSKRSLHGHSPAHWSITLNSRIARILAMPRGGSKNGRVPRRPSERRANTVDRPHEGPIGVSAPEFAPDD
jgi:hypothetical protein